MWAYVQAQRKEAVSHPWRAAGRAAQKLANGVHKTKATPRAKGGHQRRT